MNAVEVLRRAVERWDPDYMADIIRGLTSRYDQSSMWPGIQALINFYRFVVKGAIALAEAAEKEVP